jgi:hypothetical protein
MSAPAVAAVSAGEFVGATHMRPFVIAALLASAFGLRPVHSAFEDFSTAVAYCRGHGGLVKLNDDQTILCFDGPIIDGQDDVPFHRLQQGGMFVVRSTGGYVPAAINLANVLREKNAKIVVYDYCFSACASFFLVASSQAHVMSKTVVAWHGTFERVHCNSQGIEVLWKSRRDHYRIPPGDRLPENVQRMCQTSALLELFFKERGIEDRHIHEPQPAGVKKLFHLAMKQGSNGKNIVWMWNPRNYGEYFRIPITYESYPASQAEVDQILADARLRVHVFYDPPN